MKYGAIEGVNKPISRIVCGTGFVTEETTQEQLDVILDRALEMNINTIDTGREYADGHCEKLMGNWFEKRGNRDEVVFISKGGHHNEIRKRVTNFDITADIYDSLALAKTDYIDLYMLHRDDESIPIGSLVEMLHSHYEAGIIKAYGASNMTLSRLKEANTYAMQNNLKPFSITSQHFSLGEQVQDPWGGGCVSMTGKTLQESLLWYQREKMPLFAYSSMCFGLFAGQFDKENYKQKVQEGTLLECIADAYCCENNFKRLDRVKKLAEEKQVPFPVISLAYVLNFGDKNGFPTYALVGLNRPEEAEMNTQAAELVLSEQELKWLNLEIDSK